MISSKTLNKLVEAISEAASEITPYWLNRFTQTGDPPEETVTDKPPTNEESSE